MRKPGRKLFGLRPAEGADDGEAGEASGSAPADRAEGFQRLQVGLFGIAAMVLLVGLASIIGSQADLADETAVPDAAPTTEPPVMGARTPPPGTSVVVPDIPSEPSPAPLLDPLVLPAPTTSAAAPAAAQSTGAPGAKPNP